MAKIKDMKTDDEGNDYDKSVNEIAIRHGKSIISLLLGMQEAQVQQQKLFRFIRHLECFCLDPKHDQPKYRNGLQHERRMKRTPVLRRRINAFQDRKFVAISYPWKPSDSKESCKLKYKVQNRSGKPFYPSTLRDCVWDRTFNYMRAHDVKLLWVDRHSIWQPECKVDCTHKMCKQKQAAVQTMDLVYRLSLYPVGLLETRICSLDDLDLLITILEGKLVKGNGKTRQFRLSKATSLDEGEKALRLLIAITKDRWWTRAWIFQENYVAWKNMTLLMRHSSDLETRKCKCIALLGNIPGELSIKSHEFCHQATRLCLAISEHRREIKGLDQVLKAAGEYRLLLQTSDSMTAKVISDVQNRDVGCVSNRIPIIANCCQYSIRLNTGSQQVPSPSLSTLTMCLLNGEIHDNSLRELTPGLLSKKTVSGYLEAQLFRGFYAPKSKPNPTFNKGCRFINVRLRESGVLTSGHLWQLGLTIVAATFPISKLPRTRRNDDPLTPHQRARLAQLATILRSLSHRDLATQIETYLKRVGADQPRASTLSRRYLRMMAIEVVRAIDKKKKLRLASLYEPQSTSPYMAIFLWDDDDNIDRPCHSSHCWGVQ
ncbi:hypothetical protein F5Y17DRAFT_230254 [Xylariaceae sp. FL0594]|nr:hypothetical protein F5Y17DRAFT_230254 [Xylariaceae sp. FL0594]